MFKMTPNILRNFVSPKATRRYPHDVRTPFENLRGALVNEIEKCTFCGICAHKCPTQCITVDKKAATWSCDPLVCVYCGVCVDSCPLKCLHQKCEYRKPTVNREVIVLVGEARPKNKKKA